MKETLTASKRIYEGRVVTLDLVDVTLPDGNAAKREIVRHPGAVAVVPIDEDGNVILVSQYRTAADHVLIEIPAGTLNPGEDPVDCARRELQEEIGYIPRFLMPMGAFFAAPGYTTEQIHLFMATNLEYSPLPADHDEFIEVSRMPLRDALEQAQNGMLHDGKSIIGILRVARHLGL